MPSAKQQRLTEKAQEVYRSLKKVHPDAHCELNFSNPLELLVATILSAQCTDVRVNIVTSELFKRCRTVSDYDSIPIRELEKIVQSAGFYRNKAKNIKAMAQKVLAEYGGVIPDTMEDLVSLPGVGRKTANVVLGNAFSKPGLPVDTHVTRLSNRIGLTKQEDAVKIEHELCALLSPKQWCMFSHLLIFHGRRVCKARSPQCEECQIAALCNFNLKAGNRGK